MKAQRCDVFISYRREGGAELAQLVDRDLRDRGYRAFLDVKTLRTGHFDDALLRRIADASDFVLILNPGALDRCQDPGDWVRKEIAEALRRGLNIVPLKMAGFRFPPREAMPPELQDLPRHNAFDYSHDKSDESLDRLCAMLRAKPGWSARARRRLVGAAVVLAALLTVGGSLLGYHLLARDTAGLRRQGEGIKDDTTHIRTTVAGVKQDTTDIKKGVEGLGKLGGLIKGPQAPAEFYHNARVHELSGDFRAAFADYRKYVESNQEFVDPLASYSQLLRTQEGHDAAVAALAALQQKHPDNAAVRLARCLLSTGDARLKALRELADARPDFGPAYLALADYFSPQQMPERSLLAAREEAAYLRRFLAQHEKGDVLKYYLDKRQGEEAVRSASARLTAGKDAVGQAFTVLNTATPIVLHLNDPQARTAAWCLDGSTWIPLQLRPFNLAGRSFYVTTVNWADGGEKLYRWRDERLEKDFEAAAELLLKYTDGRGVESQPFSGGRVALKSVWPGTIKDQIGNPLQPNRLDLAGRDVKDYQLRLYAMHVRYVGEVSLSGARFPPEGLAHLRRFGDSLHVLRLDRTDLTDAALEQVGALWDLEELYLAETPITDTGLGHLKALKRLRVLDLRKTRVGDDGVVPLADSPRLEVLRLEGTDVKEETVTQMRKNRPHCEINGVALEPRPRSTDSPFEMMRRVQTERIDLSGKQVDEKTFRDLQQYFRLNTVVLARAKFDNAHLKYLASCITLRTLDLQGSSLDDEGLKHLAHMPLLSTLDLRDTAVSDQGAAGLGDGPSLTRLDLRGSKVTDKGLAALRKSLPRCKITP